MNCKKCNTALIDKAVACHSCGSAVETVTASDGRTFTLDQVKEITELVLQKEIGKLVQQNRLPGIESIDGAAGGNPSGKSIVRSVPTGRHTWFGAPETKIQYETLSKEMDEFIGTLQRAIGGRQNGATFKTINVGNNASAGFLIPGEFIATIMEKAVVDSYFLTFAPTVQMSQDIVSWPVLNQTFGANPDYYSGIDWSYIPEQGTINESTNPTFRLMELRARKAVGMQIVSSEMLDDRADFASYLTNLVGRSWGYHADEMVWRGDGVSEPLGFLTNPTVQTVARNTPTRVNLFDVIALDQALDEAFDNAIYCARKATLLDIPTDVDTVGQPTTKTIWNDPAMPAAPMRLNGKLVRMTKHAEVLGTQGDLVLKDPSAFLIGLRKSLELAISTDFLFNTDCVAMRWINRWDSRIVYEDGIQVLAT